MTQATSPSFPLDNFPLPQELVDLIIDQVAYASSGYDAESQSDLTGLITCSLICQRFYPRARAHLHRHVHFKAHIDTVDERAYALLESLRKQTAECQSLESIPIMQSLSLVIHDNLASAINSPALAINRHRPQRESGLGGFSELIRHGLTLFSSTLEHFSLILRCSEQQDATTHARAPTVSLLNHALLGVFTSTNLKTLRLVNLSNVPLKKLTDIFFLPYLVELTLNSLTFAPATAEGLEVLNTKKPAPNLRRLEMRHIPHEEVLLYLRPFLSATKESFTKLEDLAISLNFNDQDTPILAALSQMGSFMERSSPGLKTLEIETYSYPDVGKYFQSSTRSRIPLNKLPALQSLRFSIRNGTSLDFLKKILGDLVLGCRCCPSFRGSFQTLELKVILQAPEHPTHPDELTILHGITEACHAKIDPILASPHTVAFSNLENIKILVFLFHHTSSNHISGKEHIEGCMQDDERHWRDAFPLTMATNRVNLTVAVRNVFSEDTMENHLKYSCCTEEYNKANEPLVSRT